MFKICLFMWTMWPISLIFHKTEINIDIELFYMNTFVFFQWNGKNSFDSKKGILELKIWSHLMCNIIMNIYMPNMFCSSKIKAKFTSFLHYIQPSPRSIFKSLIAAFLKKYFFFKSFWFCTQVLWSGF